MPFLFQDDRLSRRSTVWLKTLTCATLLLLFAAMVRAEETKPAEEPAAAAFPIVEPQIVGGDPVSDFRYQQQFRWVVALLDASGGYQFCGGSLIHAEWVVTAAHCVPGLSPGDLQVLVGTPTLSSGGTRVDVVGIVPHPRYDPSTEQNDIALLRLATPVSGPVALLANQIQTNRRWSPGRSVNAMGWGNLTEGGSSPDRLHEVRLPTVSTSDCRSVYGQNAIADTMLCAGRPSGGIDTCQGDSGGPLAANSTNGWILFGITSWGYGCAQPGYYGVYTRVGSYRTWINNVINGQGFCILGSNPRIIRRPQGFDCYGLPHNDDSSAGPVDLGFTARLGGTYFTQVYVNNNGNLTFGAPLSTFTPSRLSEVSVPVIAPYFADVDTSAAESRIVYYGQGEVGGNRTFSAVWQQVGYFRQHADRLNTFQVVLIERFPGSGAFDVEFNYGNIQWESGDFSGGSGGLGGQSARVGMSLVPARPRFEVELAGSGTPGSFIDGGAYALRTGSNVGNPGRYRWRIRRGRPQ